MLALSQSVSKSYSRVNNSMPPLHSNVSQTTSTCLSCPYSPLVSGSCQLLTKSEGSHSTHCSTSWECLCPAMKVTSLRFLMLGSGSGFSSETPPTSTSLGHCLSFWVLKQLHSCPESSKSQPYDIVFAPVALSPSSQFKLLTDQFE